MPAKSELPMPSMRRIVLLPLLLITSVACASESAPADQTAAKSEPVSKPEPAPAAKTAPEPTPTSATPSTPTPSEPTPSEPTPVAAPSDPKQVQIVPWTTKPFAPTWRTVEEPSEALAFVELDAGILARVGTSWFTRGEADVIVPVTMDREPTLPIFGVWPSDAWMIETRTKNEDDFEYVELRLMKLRGGDRWVPQARGGEQWWHPGTENWYEPEMSAVTGMLVHTVEFDEIERVAGRLGDPEIGPHRGNVVALAENGQGKLYVLSVHEGAYWAQTACEDADDPDACVEQRAMKLPLDDWKFGRAVARGKHSVSVRASAAGREFILHHRGKSDGWVLDELPAGEVPRFMWASEEGSLWTLAGERLRWRDTDSAWHEVALPPGLTTPSLALSEDRKEVWLAGSVGGATKIFACSANTVQAPPAP